MLGDKAQAARARGRDGDRPAQQRVARRLGVPGQQTRSGKVSSGGCGGHGVTRAALCERACTPSNRGNGESRAGPRVRARSGLQLEQAAQGRKRKRKPAPGEKEKGEEKEKKGKKEYGKKMDLNKMN
jgi:hypothetical protein